MPTVRTTSIALVLMALVGTVAWTQDQQQPVGASEVLDAPSLADPVDAESDASALGNAPTTSTLTERLEALERQRLFEDSVREAQLQLVESNQSFVGILLAVVGVIVGLFALAVTISGIIFALRVEKNALAIVRTEISDRKIEIDAAAIEIAAAATELQSMRQNAESHAKIIEEAAIKASNEFIDEGTTEQEKKEITIAEGKLLKKSLSDLSIDELKIRIGAASSRSDNVRAYQLAVYLELQYPDDEPANSFALFAQAVALTRQNQYNHAAEIYEHLINKHSNSEIEDVQTTVARAHVNLGAALAMLGNLQGAITIADELASRVNIDAIEDHQEALAKALFNKANHLTALDRIPESVAVIDTIVNRFGQSKSPHIRGQVERSLFNKACFLARLNNVAETIGALRDWAALADHFDCQAVKNDEDFDTVRNTQEFKNLMTEFECGE